MCESNSASSSPLSFYFRFRKNNRRLQPLTTVLSFPAPPPLRYPVAGVWCSQAAASAAAQLHRPRQALRAHQRRPQAPEHVERQSLRARRRLRHRAGRWASGGDGGGTCGGARALTVSPLTKEGDCTCRRPLARGAVQVGAYRDDERWHCTLEAMELQLVELDELDGLG
jgi:hypothetical protein